MSKAKVAELAKRLREAARMQDPFAQAAIEMVRLASENVKESLVTAEGDDMLRLQGAARHLSKLHTELTTTPPGIGAEQETQR